MLTALPGSASADLFAVTEVAGANGDTDLARFDVGTGARQSLPSSVNSAADEVHPSLSPDGKRLAYESFAPSVGTNRIVALDLGSGTSADLINAFDTLSVMPNDPDWSDNSHITIGENTGETPNPSGTFNAEGMSIGVSSFPSGPFPRTSVDFGDFPQPGRTIQYERRPVPGTTRVLDIAGFRAFTGAGRIMLRTNSGTPVVLSGPANVSDDHPTMSTADQVIVFERSAVGSTGDRFGPMLAFTNLSLSGLGFLPTIVNTEFDERPDFSFDGRYLGFVRINSTGTPHLFVWDTETQVLVNPAGGIDLGALPSNAGARELLSNDGAIAIGDPALILNSSILANGLIAFNIASLSNIGIIVQKVVGHTRLLGHRAPRLRFIGRVPLGRFHKGRNRIHWDRRVNGKRLSRGLYQITLRSVTKSAEVRDLGRPVMMRIH
jgi:hypothetical protein